MALGYKINFVARLKTTAIFSFGGVAHFIFSIAIKLLLCNRKCCRSAKISIVHSITKFEYFETQISNSLQPTFMQRKKIISAAFLAVGSLKAMSESFPLIEIEEPSKAKIPPYLIKGDTISICSPAGFITLSFCAIAITIIESYRF